MEIKIILLIYMIIINLIGFITCGVDKHKAKKREWRIPEKTFFVISALAGSVGTYMGLLFFCHKTRHWYFMIGIPAIFIAEAAAVYFVYTKFF